MSNRALRKTTDMEETGLICSDCQRGAYIVPGWQTWDEKVLLQGGEIGLRIATEAELTAATLVPTESSRFSLSRVERARISAVCVQRCRHAASAPRPQRKVTSQDSLRSQTPLLSSNPPSRSVQRRLHPARPAFPTIPLYASLLDPGGRPTEASRSVGARGKTLARQAPPA